ncbi:hypothetical protein [Haloarcula marismortui]|uniref:Uncharacterized protein n=1 Tax=Haloarcula marismortui ATCC 33799 TaxID=662475 RepID=M0KVE9_9EURY|nr:hypothetical protein [Haloarcula californiae]EMA24888.1 hypothetical protein C435_03308 [Haloarcula californiae ATCC 33799]
MSTDNVVIQTPDGETDEYNGVLFAEKGINPESGTEGIALQCRAEDRETPKAVFVDKGEVIAVYGEVSRERLSETFLECVDPEAVAE